MSTLVNGFTFAFPSVNRAYSTSIERPLQRDTWRALLVGGLPLALGGGIMVFILHVVFGALVAYLRRMNGNCLALGVLLLYPAAMLTFGYLVGGAVGRSALRAKYPDAQKVGKVALVVALAGYLSYLIAYVVVTDPAVRFNSWVDYVRQAFYLLCVGGTGWAAAAMKVEESPYCNTCGEFMQVDEIGHVTWDESGRGWGLASEPAVIEILNARQFAKLQELGNEWAKDNFTAMKIWHCPQCAANGFVDCITTQSRIEVNRKGETSRKTANVLVHSSHLLAEEIATLLEVRGVLSPPLAKEVAGVPAAPA